MYGDPSSEPRPEDRESSPEMPFYTRQWHFDPYHQALSFAREHAPSRSETDTEWLLWEVFQQSQRGEHHVHVGSLHAPDAEVALVLAKENYARRGPCVNLWVVPANRIHATDYGDSDVFEHTTDKSYREPSGYHGLRKAMIKSHERDHSEASAAAEADAVGKAVANAGASYAADAKAEAAANAGASAETSAEADTAADAEADAATETSAGRDLEDE